MTNGRSSAGWPPPAVVRELQQNEFRAYFDSAPFAMVLADAAGRFIEVNGALCAMLGYERGELLGHNFLSTLYPDGLDTDLAAFERMRRGQIDAYQTERKCFHRSGEIRWIKLSVGAIRGADNTINRYVAHAEDITAQKDAEAEQQRLREIVRRTEQLSAMGGLVGGVAHEVRNPLFAITATIDAMEHRLGDRTEYQRYVKALRAEASRMTELMQRLLAYGKPVIAEHRPGDLREVLRAAEGIEQLSAHNKSVRFTLRAGDRPLWVQMDFERLVSAFQNLLDNAVHFSAEGGAVEIDVTETGRKITCTIRDHGPGFEPGDHEKVFQPFFTRRPAGTGLGLSIVQKIFHEHGGEVTAANHPDGGAIVTVRLPLLTHPH